MAMKQKGAAFLWDESFLWGLMAYRAFRETGLPFDLIKAEDVKAGVLDNYTMLFVPGGWASNKSKALGQTGIEAVQDFVSKGGNYLGFCGGAGLATKTSGGIGLLNVKRRPTKERVPSFSGRIELKCRPHPVWKGQGSVFHAWWPSQLVIEDSGIDVLAAYGDALPDSFSSDLNVGDVELNGSWTELEKVYQINLDPRRLADEPSVIEGSYGKGKVLLSLVHFDTPGDTNGQQVLINLWRYLAGEHRRHSQKRSGEEKYNADVSFDASGLPCSVLYTLCSELMSLGERNFLWFRRNSMLYQWRRGVRGLEYNTLYIMIREIAQILGRRDMEHGTLDLKGRVDRIEALLIPFTEKAERLLIRERHALQSGHITYEKCDDPEIQGIRKELFSDAKSHGGMFKGLLDEVDALLFELIKTQ